MTVTTSALKVTPVEPRIGAVIEGVTLSGELDDATVSQIRAALLKHKVVLFRGQHHMGDAEMEGFAELMGDPIAHPTIADTKGSRYLLNLVANSAYASSQWHTDLTYLPAYPAASLIRAVELPPSGGDTMWANCATAYQDMPEPLRAMADRLWALHSSEIDFDLDYAGEAWDKVAVYRELPPQDVIRTEHPLVRVHPESGERVLVTGTFIRRLIGFDIFQSRKILDLLQEYIVEPKNCMRWSWKEGDVAMWDNRATQHRVVADFGEEPRNMRRATIHGSVPVAVDGRESRAIPGPAA